MIKKIIALVLCMAMVASLFVATGSAADGEANVSLSVSKDTVSVGEEVVVVLSYSDMNVISFACGFLFDTEKFECKSIVGADPEYPDDFGLVKKSGKNPWVPATVVPTVEDSNNTGSVGFVCAGTVEAEYEAGVILTATLVSKVAGNTDFVLFEDSDGTDGCKYTSSTLALEKSNVSMKISDDTVSVGEEVVVVLSYKDMTVSSFACGFFFDNEKFECKSIVGADPEWPEDFGLNKASGKNTWVSATAFPTVAESNGTGTVGFVVAGTIDVEYAADVILTATFVAKEEGVADFTLYEDSDGADGFKSDAIVTKSVAIHNFSDWSNHSETQHVRKCSCGKAEYAAHTWNEGEITTPATHLTFGVKTYTCTECSATRTEEVAKLEGHTFSDWENHDEAQHSRKCACGEVEYADHTWNEGEITTPATHLTFGVKTYTCTECSATRTEEVPKSLLDVDLDGDVDETDAELLLQYITAHEVEVNEAVIDCNGDGKVNIRDVATILIYIKSEE